MEKLNWTSILSKSKQSKLLSDKKFTGCGKQPVFCKLELVKINNIVNNEFSKYSKKLQTKMNKRVIIYS